MEERARDLEPDEERSVEELEGRLAARAGCPPPEMLLAARAGVLPEESGAKVEAHAANCPWCRALRENLTEEELSKLTPREREHIRKRVLEQAGARGAGWRWFLRPAPVAALAMLAVAGGLWIYVTRPASRSGGAVEPAVVKPPDVLRLEKPPVKLPAAAALLWRGQAAPAEEEFLTAFGAAVEPYRAGDYREAVSRLEALAQRYPNSAEAQFYLGVSRLFLERNQEAVRALAEAKRLAAGTQAQDAAWYLGIAWLRAGGAEQGATELRGLCSGAGEYKVRACAALKELGR